MRLIRGLTNLKNFAQQADGPLAKGCVATIGNFDGVHLGHQTIIDQVHEKALELGVPSVVMVFEPQPREFFQGMEAPPRLIRNSNCCRPPASTLSCACVLTSGSAAIPVWVSLKTC